MSDDAKFANINWRGRRRQNREEQKAKTAQYYEDMRNKTLQSNNNSPVLNTSLTVLNDTHSRKDILDDISINIHVNDVSRNTKNNVCKPLKEICIDNFTPIYNDSASKPIHCISTKIIPQCDESYHIEHMTNTDDVIANNALIKTMTGNYTILEQHTLEIEKELCDTNKFIASLILDKKSLFEKSADIKAGTTFNNSLYEFNSQIELLNIDVNKCDSNIYEEQKKLHDQVTAKNYARGLGVTNRELSSYYNKYINMQFLKRVEFQSNIENIHLKIDELKDEQKRLVEIDWDIMIHDVQVSIDAAKLKSDNSTTQLNYIKNLGNNVATLIKLEKISLMYIKYAKYYNITLTFDINTLNINDDNYYENLIEIIVSCNYHHQDYLLFRNKSGKGYFANINCGKKDVNGNICKGYWTNWNNKCECGSNTVTWNDNKFNGLEIDAFTIESMVPYGTPEIN